MSKLIKKISRFSRIPSKIRKLNLSENLKYKILKTCFRLIFLEEYYERSKIIDLVGYKVRFCTRRSFSALFNELFIEQEYYFSINKTKPFIIDCGSNIGLSVLYFKTIYPDSEILAFEPDRETFSCLEANVKSNGLQHIEMINKAVFNKEGEIPFYFNKEDPGSLVMSIMPERQPGQSQIVKSVLLSKYIDKEVDYLKIDIEGAEGIVVEELNKAGKLHYIKQMIIEYHHHILKDTDELSPILKILEDAGFGYQIRATDLKPPYLPEQFQNMHIYAYQKNRIA